jgi:hypothetical protein
MIDCDYRGAALVGEVELPYPQREYSCPACARRHTGWRIIQASPPEFLLQPHPMYPMTRKTFNYWAGILRRELPDHPSVPEIGKTFVPNHHVLLTRLWNIMLRRRYYFGRLRRRVRQLMGTGS